MLPADVVVHHEIPVIRKIIQDETWLEGERRGCEVSPDDHVVRDRVCNIVLEIGQQLRDSITRGLPSGEHLMLTAGSPDPVLDWQI